MKRRSVACQHCHAGWWRDELPKPKGMHVNDAPFEGRCPRCGRVLVITGEVAVVDMPRKVAGYVVLMPDDPQPGDSVEVYPLHYQ